MRDVWFLRGGLIAMVLGAGLLMVSAAAADDVEKSRRHFENGKALMDAEDFAGAVVEFEISVSMYPTRNGLFNLANSYKAAHKYEKALAAFARLRAEFGDKLNSEMRVLAKSYEAQITALVGHLTIVTKPARATVQVDGEVRGTTPLAATVVLGPGPHEVQASLNGYKAASQQVVITSGKNEAVTLTLESDLSAPVTEPASPLSKAEQAQGEPVSAASVKSDKGREPTLTSTKVLIAGVVLTAVAGATTGILAYQGNRISEKFQSLKDEVENGVREENDPGLSKTRNTGKSMDAATIGVGVVTGAFAVATIVVLGINLHQRKARKAAKAASVALRAGAFGPVIEF